MRHIKRFACQEFHICSTFITDKNDDKRIVSYLGNVFFTRKQFSSPGEGTSPLTFSGVIVCIFFMKLHQESMPLIASKTKI